MSIPRPEAKIVLTCIIFVLVGALVFSLVTINNKNAYINDIKSQISENEELLAEADEKISEGNKANSTITSELEAAKAEKKKLEEENAALKKKIEALSAQKPTYVPAVPQLPPASKVCYLTFDDGPSDNTPKILDILKKYNIKATFFVINTNKMDYLKRMYNEGHTIGLHSYSHNYQNIYSSTDAYFADLQKLSDKVQSIIGIKSTVIRFPGGSSNKVSQKHNKGIMTRLTKMVEERGYNYFDWNVVSGDADAGGTKSYTYIKNNVINRAKNKDSACVLMHDASSKTTTVQALPYIIEGLRAQGYRFDVIKPNTHGYHQKVIN